MKLTNVNTQTFNTSLTVYEADMGGQWDFGSMSFASHFGSADLKVIISLAGSPLGGFGSGWIPEFLNIKICTWFYNIFIPQYLHHSNLYLKKAQDCHFTNKRVGYSIVDSVALLLTIIEWLINMN